MNFFRNLSAAEKEELLKLPVYITLLAANGDGKLDEAEIQSAIKLSHTKTFSCEPLLKDYYREADKVFNTNLRQQDFDLPGGKENREEAIRLELQKLEPVIQKLGKRYASRIRQSMKAFNEHVSNAHHTVVVDFILPLPIPGLTEK